MAQSTQKVSKENALHNIGSRMHKRQFPSFYFCAPLCRPRGIRRSQADNTWCTCQIVRVLQNVRTLL